MNEYPLRERTIVIFGYFSTTVQNLMMNLCSAGADVALIGPQADQAVKYCSQLNDQREIKEKFGRSLAIPMDPRAAGAIRDSLGRVVQTFGGMDVFIDFYIENKKTPFQFESPLEQSLDQMIFPFQTSLSFTHQVVPFLKSRKKGRIIYMLNQSMMGGQALDTGLSSRSALVSLTKGLSQQLSDQPMTFNVLSLGATEEFLLGHYPDAGSIKVALEKHRTLVPSAKISEPEKIAQAITFLASSSGSAINGQVIEV